MVTLEDAAQMCLALPDVTAGQRFHYRTWYIGKKGFAWERPLSKADVKRFAPDTPPAGPLLALATEDLVEKEAILATAGPGFFTIAHFNHYPAYLVALHEVDEADLREAIRDAWLACAPEPLARAYLAEHGGTVLER
ncbi:MAG: hypothetical protein JO247_15120 [Chloroflexi bacterium]|nr:hypothetical protein [Chloroflexota bacterium]